MKKLMQKPILFKTMSVVAIMITVMSVMTMSATANIGPKTAKAAESEEEEETEKKWNTGESILIKQEDCHFFAYLSKDGKESWIYQVRMKKDGIKELAFPAKVNHAPVTRIGYGTELYDAHDLDCYYTIFYTSLEPWHNAYDTDVKADSIVSIKFPATLTRIDVGAFCGLKKLKKLEIPDGVETLPSYIFAACPKLTEVKLPAGLKSFNVEAFDKSKAIKKLSVPSESTEFRIKKGYLLSKDSKKIVWAPPALKKVSIPGGVTKLNYGALCDSQAKEVIIPKSVRNIGAEALSGAKIKKITLKKGNKAYKMDRGCIYKKSDKSLIAILVKKRWAKISSKVKVLGDGISIMGVRARKIKRVNIPKSVQRVTGDWEFFNDHGLVCSAVVYFHGKTPPEIVGKNTQIPCFNKIYVPKKAKKAYIRWAKDKVISIKSWSKEYLYTF